MPLTGIPVYTRSQTVATIVWLAYKKCNGRGRTRYAGGRQQLLGLISPEEMAQFGLAPPSHAYIAWRAVDCMRILNTFRRHDTRLEIALDSCLLARQTGMQTDRLTG